jgi:hypothetical protein
MKNHPDPCGCGCHPERHKTGGRDIYFIYVELSGIQVLFDGNGALVRYFRFTGIATGNKSNVGLLRHSIQ